MPVREIGQKRRNSDGALFAMWMAMNVLRLALILLLAATVFPSEALSKGSGTSGSHSGSQQGKPQKREKLDRALRTPSKLSGTTRVIIRHRADKSDNVRSK